MSQGKRRTNPRRVVEEAFRQSFDARSIWGGVAGELPNNEVDRSRDSAHLQLQATTAQYFEAMQPYLATAPAGSKARDYWENAPCIPVEALTRPGAKCEQGHVFGEADIVGRECPQCGATIRGADVIKRDEDGNPVGKWKPGLKHLEDHMNEVQEIETKGGRWSGETKVETVPKRIAPDVLILNARYLDKAARTLDLLADTKDPRPLTEV